MPIEIRELIIKARVDTKNATSSSGNDSQKNQEALINEIVDRVFRIMEQKQER